MKPIGACFGRLNPQRFFQALAAIDREAAAERAAVGGTDRRPAVVLTTAAVCLLLLHYLKFRSSFLGFLDFLAPALGYQPAALRQLLYGSGWFDLIAYGWWGFWHLLAYLLIPLAVIRFLLCENVCDYGLRLGALNAHWRGYALLCSPILCFVVLVSFRQDFATHYPFYDQAHRSWADLLAWECIYGLQFVCLEFFFRGFMLQGCKRAFGGNAVFVMCLPYLMIHFPKPWLEATGAILFGLFLGVLALRSRSIWGGVAVHLTIAFSMDVAALLQGRGLPSTFWP